MPDFHEATFLNSATDTMSKLYVRITEFGDQAFGDPDGITWTPSGGALPQAGDRALVAESDDGSWWVLSWWSSTQTVDTGPEAVRYIGAGGQPSFANGWVNFAASTPAGFYRDRGRVYLTGKIKSGTVGATAFTLPDGYLIDESGGADFACVSNAAFGNLIVLAAGQIVPFVGSNVWFSLDGVSFRHA